MRSVGQSHPGAKVAKVPAVKRTRASKEPLNEQEQEALRASKRLRLEGSLIALERGEDGRVGLPLKVAGVTLEAFGTIDPWRHAYHGPAYLFPIGYRTTRMFARMDKPDEKCLYTQEIIDGGDQPMFQISAEIGGDPVLHQSSTGAWSMVLAKVRATREASGQAASKTAISGIEVKANS
ncbi:hypothetical protein CYMTET_22812 [Cymbomonas tetramitiformis]|uniref:Uncharacterized protein n=1 Tax=Cymbomonas tetramitiformis TaxID=36881 RepID=A0AAE0L1K0_9CHLO|nr:hypothetical protein CYMTET_22812 [Cymbomonas tetramitiformis]